MKNKGYTLIELLGVIIILSLLVSFAIPTIINVIKSSTTKKDKLVEDIIINAAEMYVDDYDNEFYSIYGNVSCISLNDLVELDYLKNKVEIDGKDIINTKSVKISYTGKYNYEIVDSNACQDFVVDLMNLTPVIYDGENWVIANKKEKWYDYSKQEWANAVILKSDSTKKVGDKLVVDGETPDILGMYVWIPRYEYKTEGTYGKGGTSLANFGEIDVNFISKNKVTPSSGYTIHSAFKFGNEELNGIWVGKFEISHATKTSTLDCTNETCANADGIRVLPNIKALTKNTVSSFFYAIRSMTRNGNPFNFNSNVIDPHLIKNSEWESVAYLVQTKYGKYGNDNYEGVNKAVYQNKSDTMITGSSNGTPVQETVNTQCSYDDMTNNCGVGASTTGNIYGVYDMNGGAFDYVMAVYMNSDGEISVGGERFNSGFTGKLHPNGVEYEGAPFPDKKYYDVTTGTAQYNEYPWKARGGVYSDKEVGMFETRNIYGYASVVYSTRIALVKSSK